MIRTRLVVLTVGTVLAVTACTSGTPTGGDVTARPTPERQVDLGPDGARAARIATEAVRDLLPWVR